MNLVFLTSDVGNSKPRTLRLIRFVQASLGASSTLDDAFRAYDALLEDGEVLLGSGDDEQVARAVEAIERDGSRHRVEPVNDAEIGEATWEEPPQSLMGQLLKGVQPQPSGNEPSFKAAKASMILLHAVDGNPTYALSIARALGRVTDDTLWNEVEDVILESFPPVRIN